MCCICIKLVLQNTTSLQSLQNNCLLKFTIMHSSGNSCTLSLGETLRMSYALDIPQASPLAWKWAIQPPVDAKRTKPWLTAGSSNLKFTTDASGTKDTCTCILMVFECIDSGRVCEENRYYQISNPNVRGCRNGAAPEPCIHSPQTPWSSSELLMMTFDTVSWR